ncbi:hypothetical protein Tco_1239456 [Tanacetum coccineum]
MDTRHLVIGATCPVNSSGAVTGPPVNGGQRRQSTVANDDQRRRTTVNHRRTTDQPPSDHQSTVGSNGGHRCHRAAKWYMWQHVAADMAADVA